MIPKPPSEYHIETAALMADLSLLVYPQEGESPWDWEDRCRDVLRDRFGVTLRIVSDDINTAIVIEFPAVEGADAWRVIVVRGTDQMEDWSRINLQYDKRKEVIGHLHRGYAEATLKLNQLLFQSATGRWASYRPTWITGHSMGGAVATLLPHVLDMTKCSVKGIYTFGQPRVGCRDFRQLHNRVFGDITFRHWSYGDPTPHAPPFWRGYVHTETGFYLDAEGKIHRSPTYWQRFKNILRALVKDKRHWHLHLYHQMQEYRELLQKNLTRMKGES